MQPKYNLNNKSSNLIQMNQEQKRKSRHRVIGSVALLFVALVILLNVTSNVRPIAINPQVVEIKNTTNQANAANIKISSSANLAQQESNNGMNNESVTANVIPHAQVVTTNTTTSSPTMVATNSSVKNVASTTTVNNNGFKAGVVTANKATNTKVINQPQNANSVVNNTNPQKQINKSTPTTAAVAVNTNNIQQQPSPQPKPSAKPKINPAAILDDVADVGHELVTDAEKKVDANKVYIQFAALSTQDKATKLQQDLASHGVSATIQQIQTPKGTLYRLRAGPFNRDKAQSKLQELSSDGYSGILTSK